MEMEREAELNKIAPAFLADVYGVILRYRGIEGRERHRTL